ncbi:MAG TPA: fumarylacetoacetate hydrolase family protein [Verrucomicrobiae bacterium]|nr:fumarylacetoacetate hydrolase family protein [Verrucomicrobiae bacterium]
MKIIRGLDHQRNTVFAAQQTDASALKLAAEIFYSPKVTSERVEVAKLLAPIQPSAIICIGLNYRKHAEETCAKFPEFPVVFFKGINILQHPGEPILLPTHLKSSEVEYECELAVVIGRACKNVNHERALDFVLGYTCCNDVIARDWQIKRGSGQWSRGKTFDTFSPLGTCLVTRDEIPNPNALKIRTILNGQIMQDWNTNDMIFDVPVLIEFLSGSTTLLPGTVILTGRPHGVGMAQKPPRWLRPGDQVSIEIEKFGALTNPVAEEP